MEEEQAYFKKYIALGSPLSASPNNIRNYIVTVCLISAALTLPRIDKGSSKKM